MRRPLYIDGSRLPVEVGLDGPALLMRQPNCADARAPLRLLSRIAVTGNVRWAMAALLACCDGGVPVAFLRGDGSVRGWCVGDGEATTEINALLEDATMQPHFAGQHADWLRGLERRAIVSTMRSLGVAEVDLRPSQVWAAFEARIDELSPPVNATIIMRVLGGALTVQIAALLRGEGVGTRFVNGHGAPVRLAADFERLLVWELWPCAERAAIYFCRHGEKHRDETAVRRRIVRRYEAAAPMIERSFADLFWRLRWHLREVLP